MTTTEKNIVTKSHDANISSNLRAELDQRIEGLIREAEANGENVKNAEFSIPMKLPVHVISTDDVALRTAIDKDAEVYKDLREDIKNNGYLNPISVRRLQNGTFCVIDGRHRFEVAHDLALEYVPVNFKPNVSHSDVLYLQISANLQKVDTKPAQYAGHLNRLMAANPAISIDDMARKLNKSPSWLQQRLSLGNLTPQAATLVDADKIPLVSGVQLARLDKETQAELLDYAQTEKTEDFLLRVREKMKEQNQKVRQATKSIDPDNVMPPANVKKKGDILDRFSKLSSVIQSMSPEQSAMLQKLDENDPVFLAGAFHALRWVCGMSDEDIEAFRSKKREEAAERARKAADKEAPAEAVASVSKLVGVKGPIEARI